MKAHIKVTGKLLKMFREAEIAAWEEVVAQDRAKLAALEPQIRKYSVASELYDWMLARRVRAENKGGEEAKQNASTNATTPR
jgi:hypothetical protein